MNNYRTIGVLLYAVVSLVCAFLGHEVHAADQDRPAAKIAVITFEGLARTEEVVVRNLIELSVGDDADDASLERSVQRLLATGRFLTVKHTVANVDSGIAVTFHVRERVIVTTVDFSGNKKFSEGQLRSVVHVTTGEAVDWFSIRDGRDAIAAKYHEEGYNDVAVTFDQSQIEQTGELVYSIDEGTKRIIREVLFEGNESFRDSNLKRKIETKKKFWIIHSGAFDEDRAQADAAKLQRFYRDEGFLDARVLFRSEAKDDSLTVVFSIQEGARYLIEDIQFRGNTVFSPEELHGKMNSQIGQVVQRLKVERDARMIHEAYGELGHIYSAVRPVQVFSTTPGLVRLTIEINEGEAFRVGRVIVRGNTGTKDKVVRRALNLYPPDDLFDLTEARRAEKLLRETRIFSSARVLPIGNQPGVRDAVIDVQEADKTGDFIFNAGVTSNSGLVGSIVLDMPNFDITDYPRSWSELFRLRSFYGGGQHLRIELQPGTDINRFRIDFTEPYMFDKPLRFDTGVYLFGRGRKGYDEIRAGASVSIGKRFEKGILRGWTGEWALRIENAQIDDVELFTSSEVRDDEGGNIMTSLKGSLVRDRTDNRFVPTTGDRMQVGYQQFGILGGDHLFGKLTASYRWYRTLRTDLQGRKSVLHLRARGGVIVGNAPVYERFYAGGVGTIRGFSFRGIGPRDGIDDTNIGGNTMLLLGGEYSYPVYGEMLRGVVFLDTGSVGSGGFRASIGTGLRLTINLFGRPVPLEFHLAAPFSTQDGDDIQVFSFLMGATF